MILSLYFDLVIMDWSRGIVFFLRGRFVFFLFVVFIVSFIFVLLFGFYRYSRLWFLNRFVRI